MKYSIRKQMIGIFVGLIVCMIIGLFIINAFFLQPYYVENKKESFVKMYDDIGKVMDDGNIQNDSVRNTLAYTAERYSFSYMVYNFAERQGYSNVRDTEKLLQQLTGVLLNQPGSQMLEKTDSYQIIRFNDVDSGSEYLALWGEMGNGYNIFIRSPIESIRESIMLFDRFLLLVGTSVIVAGILFVWYFSRRLTEPLMELTALSVRMADLDFDAKYTSGGKNEIGVLGENFNVMSQKLEEAVSELKSANYRLQQDIEKKEKLEKMRTDFMGNVSHELKTPIALIQGYAEGLKEGVSDDPESMQFYCDVIIDEADKMNQMVKNLMTLNQLEFGDQDVQFERFDLTELIKGVLQSMEILIQQKDAKIQFRTKEPVYVWADEFKAEQVLRNYVNNALNHLDGDKVIDIKILCHDEKAKVTVFNTGIPIPEDDLPHIWEKFYKVDKAHTREYGGNGIGLSIVKAIMDSFHQEYGVNNYDNGVEFWFELDRK